MDGRAFVDDLLVIGHAVDRLWSGFAAAGTAFGPYQVALMKLRLSSIGLVDTDGSDAGDSAAATPEESPA